MQHWNRQRLRGLQRCTALHGHCLCFARRVLSPELLTANIQALTNAQGACPRLGPLPDGIRVAVAGNRMHLEIRSPRGAWEPLEAAAAAGDASAWTQSVGDAGADQVVMVGVGLGDALRAQQHARRVIAIEPHAGVATLLLSTRDWRPWIAEGRLRLLTGPDYAGAADVARVLDGLRGIAIVSNAGRAQREPDAMGHALAVANRVAQNAKANGHARRRFAKPYLLQTLANLSAIGAAADVQALERRFAGVPAVVVGAGPSLDDNLPRLAALQDRALIVAADTSLRPLLIGGVQPHLAVAVDSSALNARHLTDAPDAPQVALACEGSVHPSAMARFAGRSFTFRIAEHEPWPWLRAAGVRRGEIKTWGSVLTSAFNLARLAGCDPIIFVGADMAFTGMRPYCRHTIYDAMWQEWIDRGCTWEALMEEYFSRQQEVWRDDVRGASTRTAPHLLSFRDWLIEQSLTAKERVINATGGGILHGGRVQQATLDEALAPAARVPQLHATVQACHADAVARSQDAQRVCSLLRSGRTRPETLPIDRWRAFAVDTVTREEIFQALPDHPALEMSGAG
jgi:hypothetical protein